MAKTVLVDSGYWIALLNERDKHHYAAVKLSVVVERYRCLVPWPTLYETVNTRLAKRPDMIDRFGKMLQRPNIFRFPDEKYREKVLNELWPIMQKRPMSLVDAVLRAILMDGEVDVRGMLTFNIPDYIDVCRRRGVEIIQENTEATNA